MWHSPVPTHWTSRLPTASSSKDVIAFLGLNYPTVGLWEGWMEVGGVGHYGDMGFKDVCQASQFPLFPLWRCSLWKAGRSLCLYHGFIVLIPLSKAFSITSLHKAQMSLQEAVPGLWWSMLPTTCCLTREMLTRGYREADSKEGAALSGTHRHIPWEAIIRATHP